MLPRSDFYFYFFNKKKSKSFSSSHCPGMFSKKKSCQFWGCHFLTIGKDFFFLRERKSLRKEFKWTEHYPSGGNDAEQKNPEQQQQLSPPLCI